MGVKIVSVSEFQLTAKSRHCIQLTLAPLIAGTQTIKCDKLQLISKRLTILCDVYSP